ncbi:hypothetical protein CRG98_048176 [Punica granatum]|uniref:DUF155 domain-containing protein n=1 Tax=Punica granatum TaxID=22663 RepID=A0A2I0HIC3_PUNGR|nr:hypothetical protein CRG98_048176 [Punica granatum]
MDIVSVTLAKPLSHSRPFSLTKVLTPLTVVLAAAYTPYPVSTVATHLKLFGSFVARCISSSSVNLAHTLEWNKPVSCSEVVVEVDACGFNVEVDAKSSILVRAYFFSTSVDLRGLVEQNKANFIPLTSRMTNYAVLKFGTLSCTNLEYFAFTSYELEEVVDVAEGILFFQELGACLNGSDCGYMVVFHYGSIMLFNVPEHEVDGYLKIVERHALGLLPKMRKDGSNRVPRTCGIIQVPNRVRV